MYGKRQRLLEDKIEELERLLRIRESEITLYRGILEDIGAEIEEVHQRGFQCDNPNKPVVINAVEIKFNRRIAVPIETERNLEMINLALKTRWSGV